MTHPCVTHLELHRLALKDEREEIEAKGCAEGNHRHEVGFFGHLRSVNEFSDTHSERPTPLYLNLDVLRLHLCDTLIQSCVLTGPHWHRVTSTVLFLVLPSATHNPRVSLTRTGRSQLTQHRMSTSHQHPTHQCVLCLQLLVPDVCRAQQVDRNRIGQHAQAAERTERRHVRVCKRASNYEHVCVLTIHTCSTI